MASAIALYLCVGYGYFVVSERTHRMKAPPGYHAPLWGTMICSVIVTMTWSVIAYINLIHWPLYCRRYNRLVAIYDGKWTI